MLTVRIIRVEVRRILVTLEMSLSYTTIYIRSRHFLQNSVDLALAPFGDFGVD